MSDEYVTVKLPKTTDDPDMLDGEELRDLKNELGVSWLEFVNGESKALRSLENADGDTEEMYQVVIDAMETAIERDLSADIRQASYQGAKEAVEGMAQETGGY